MLCAPPTGVAPNQVTTRLPAPAKTIGFLRAECDCRTVYQLVENALLLSSECRIYMVLVWKCVAELRFFRGFQGVFVALVSTLEASVLSVSTRFAYPPPSAPSSVIINVCTVHLANLSHDFHKACGVSLQQTVMVSRHLEICEPYKVTAHCGDGSNHGDVLQSELPHLMIAKLHHLDSLLLHPD